MIGFLSFIPLVVMLLCLDSSFEYKPIHAIMFGLYLCLVSLFARCWDEKKIPPPKELLKTASHSAILIIVLFLTEYYVVRFLK